MDAVAGWEFACDGPWEAAHICVGCEYIEGTPRLSSSLCAGYVYTGGWPCEGAHTCVGCDHIECASVWGQRSAVDTDGAAYADAAWPTDVAGVCACLFGVGLSDVS